MKSLTVFDAKIKELVLSKSDSMEISQRFNDLIESGKFESKKAEMALQINAKSLSRIKPKSISEIVDNIDELPTFATIAKYRGEIVLSALILKQVYWLKDMINVGKGMTDSQAEFIKDEIISDYPYFTINDIALVFRNGVKGNYGKFYDSLDPSTVMEWLKVYQEERMFSFSKKHQVKEYKKPIRKTEATKENLSKMSKIIEATISKMQVRQKEKSKKNIETEKNLLDDFIKDCELNGIDKSAANYRIFKQSKNNAL